MVEWPAVLLGELGDAVVAGVVESETGVSSAMDALFCGLRE